MYEVLTGDVILWKSVVFINSDTWFFEAAGFQKTSVLQNSVCMTYVPRYSYRSSSYYLTLTITVL
jgi:hypothetical protein